MCKLSSTARRRVRSKAAPRIISVLDYGRPERPSLLSAGDIERCMQEGARLARILRADLDKMRPTAETLSLRLR